MTGQVDVSGKAHVPADQRAVSDGPHQFGLTAGLLEKCGNPACQVHALPARVPGSNTVVDKTIKAVLVATLG